MPRVEGLEAVIGVVGAVAFPGRISALEASSGVGAGGLHEQMTLAAQPLTVSEEVKVQYFTVTLTIEWFDLLPQSSTYTSFKTMISPPIITKEISHSNNARKISMRTVLME